MYHNPRCLITGDFKLPNINWNTDIPKFSTNMLDRINRVYNGLWFMLTC